MEGSGPSCDRGNGGGGGSSLSSCQLLRPPQLPPQLAFAREPERGAGGAVVVEAMEAKVVVGRSCCVLIINTHPWYYVMYY